MKKNFIACVAWTAALALFVSCAKEQVGTPVSEPAETVSETVNDPVDDSYVGPSVIAASIPEQAKVALADAGIGQGLAMSWESGDQLAVIGSTTQLFTLSDGAGSTSATFQGTPVSGNSFTILYPGQSYASEEAIEARSYTSQVQDGNGGTSHLEWNARIAGVSDYGALQFYDNAQLSQNGAIKFVLTLPSEFTKVYSVALKAPSALFSTTNGGGTLTDELRLTLKTGSADGVTLGDDKTLTAFMMVSWNDNVLEAGTKLTIEVWGDQENPWTKTKTVSDGGFTIAGGKVTTLTLNGENWKEPLFWGGDGTESNPYRIKTVQNLDNIRKVLSETKTWFKLIDDIDMDGVAWKIPNTSVNNVWPIDFDGDGHTISNLSCTGQGGASLFGALYGSVYDLTLENVTIASTSQAGVLSYALNNNNPGQAVIRNITVSGASVSTSSTTDMNDVGGLAGQAVNTSFSGCRLSGMTVTSANNRAGGIVGRLSTEASVISDCTFSGNVTAVKYVGGIAGRNHVNDGVEITNCHVSSSTIKSTDSANESSFVGGIIGQAGGVTAISSCSTTGTLQTSATPGNNPQACVGGIAGSLSGSIAGSWSSMSITYTSNRQKALGGLVGASCGVMTIRTSYYAGGTVNGMSILGGLVGNCGHNLTLENCYSSGTLIAYQGYTGALVGYVSAAVTVNIRNCYSSMAVSNTSQGTNNALGGLIGGSDKAGTIWNVSGLLAWNSGITFLTSTATDGVIIGQIHPSGGTGATSFTDCWYRNDLSYTKKTTARTPDSVVSCTTPDTQRFDGQKAASGVTCAEKASELGWDASVWDFSGDFPLLK